MSSMNNTPERKALLEVAGNVSKLPSKNKAFAPRAKGQPRKVNAKRAHKTPSNTVLKTEPARPKWVQLTEFKLWEKLPIEIRTMIWKMLLPQPAVHNLEYGLVSQLRYSNRSCWDWRVVARAPTLLRVCRESREVGLEALTPMMRRPSVIVHAKGSIDIQDVEALSLKGLNDGQAPEDSPEIDNSTIFRYKDDIFGRNETGKTHGLVFQLERQNFFNLKNDICYVDGQSWTPRIYGGQDLDRFVQIINIEDSTKITHLALDFQLLTSYHHMDQYRRNHGWDTFERKLGRITEGAKFPNLKTLTLVIVDHGSLRCRSELKDFEQKYAIQKHYQDPITFADDADIGPYIRPGHRKNGRWFGPWERLAKYFGIDEKDQQEDGPVVVKAAIETTKKKFEEDLEKLRLSNPGTTYPDIKWTYLLRGGKFLLH
ncbi:hypothetical protein BDZ45DRAFT_731056 [Acephala macrosclerotiorum]|nr:hypothetical protein BDZ45DRAFT_731056 [Acephala macrosclerotiorum]